MKDLCMNKIYYNKQYTKLNIPEKN